MMRLRRRPPVTTDSALVFAVVGAALFGIAAVRGDDAPGREVPAPFLPFEYLVGSWKGQGVSREDRAQQFRGWTEVHSWAWSFQGGKPTAMSVEFKGSKLFKAGAFTYDDEHKRYQLKIEAVEPAGATLVYEGGLDASGKLLTLDRTGAKPGDTAERLTLRPNANAIRYTLIVERKPEGRVRFSPSTEVGLTKEGEKFAAGGADVVTRKCIITGGAATLSVAYQGRSFPICCTGCRDEFLENPEKYLKKISLTKEKAADAKDMPAKSAAPSRPRVRGGDDAFAGDVDDPAPSKPKSKTKSKPTDKPEPDANAEADAPKPPPVKKAADRAAVLLRVAQSLEKIGKTDVALKDYRDIVKNYPDSPAAKTAKERIKALADQ